MYFDSTHNHSKNCEKKLIYYLCRSTSKENIAKWPELGV
jgi:hypothetical protein